MNYAVVFIQSNNGFQAHILEMNGLGKFVEHCLKTTNSYERLDIYPKMFGTLKYAQDFVSKKGYFSVSGSKYIFNYNTEVQRIRCVKRKANG